MGGVKRYTLTDEQWRRLSPLLPLQRPRTGRPNHDHRTVLNGILWVLRTGAPWGDLPDRYGPVGTVSSRFDRWRHLIENAFAKLKEFRAIATRYDKTDVSFAASIHLAAAIIASR